MLFRSTVRRRKRRPRAVAAPRPDRLHAGTARPSPAPLPAAPHLVHRSASCIGSAGRQLSIRYLSWVGHGGFIDPPRPGPRPATLPPPRLAAGAHTPLV